MVNFSKRGPNGHPKFEPNVTNRRPKDLMQLFSDRAVELTFGNTSRQNRFYVANIIPVMNSLKLRHTTSDASVVFKQAATEIKAQKDWIETFDYLKFEAHPNHVSNAKRTQPKYLETAVTIIVAMEVAARAATTPINVYDYLRILPAMHFVDRFDVNRLQALESAYGRLSEEDKKGKFGEDALLSFQDLCLKSMAQPLGSRLLSEMAAGYCVTRDAAEKFAAFINANFEQALQVGPVRVAGAETGLPNLGTKFAATTFVVPQIIDVIPECN